MGARGVHELDLFFQAPAGQQRPAPHEPEIVWKKLPFPEGMDFHSSQAVAEVPRKCENSMRMTEKKRHELMCRTGSGRA